MKPTDPSCSSGKMLSRNSLVIGGLLAAFLSCTTDPLSERGDTGLILRIRVADSLLAGEMVDIDSLRLQFNSPGLASPKITTFSYSSRKGALDPLPRERGMTIDLAWLDSGGSALFTGSFDAEEIRNDTLILAVTGEGVTPRPPSHLSARVLARDMVLLTWRDNSHFEDQYVIQRRVADSVLPVRLGSTVSSTYVDSLADPFTTYHYSVYAENGAGHSPEAESGPMVIRSGGDQPPVIQILSNSNPDTVNTAVISLTGLSYDETGIAGFWVNDSALRIDGTVWRTGNYALKPGINRFALRAVDAGPSKNTSSMDVAIWYDPFYSDTTNHAPRFAARSGNLAAVLRSGQEYRKTLTAWDADGDSGLVYLIAPILSYVDDSTISWTPGPTDTGVVALWAKVFDPTGRCDSLYWSVTVLNATRNAAPVFLATREELIDSVAAGEVYRDTLSAVDLDQAAGLKYRFFIDNKAIPIDPAHGVVRWPATPADIGTHVLRAEACDDSGACGSLAWALTVYDTVPPAVEIGSDTTVSINDSVYLRGTALKKGGWIAGHAWSIGPGGAFVTTSTGDTAITVPAVAGRYTYILRATDNAGNTASASVKVNVIQDMPVVEAGSDIMLRDGELLRLSGNAWDGYGSIVKWEWRIGDTGKWITTGSPEYSPSSPLSNGRYTCYFRVTDDDRNSVTDKLTVVVTGTRMRRVDPGLSGKAIAFLMGSDDGPENESPRHSVSLSPLLADTTEVTQNDYLQLMGSNPSSFINPSRPVEGVTWFDAVLYCNARSKRDGFDTVYVYANVQGEPGNGCTGLGDLRIEYAATGYRLPTEAEWEYLCAGDSLTDGFFWGPAASAAETYAWFSGDSPSQTQPVALKRANPLGLYDMAGNVGEWCNDWYSEQYYQECKAAGRVSNPQGPSRGTLRVVRGGSWRESVSELRSANRGPGIPAWSSSFVGFRCVMQTVQ